MYIYLVRMRVADGRHALNCFKARVGNGKRGGGSGGVTPRIKEEKKKYHKKNVDIARGEEYRV
jgi:hypothetical protein